MRRKEAKGDANAFGRMELSFTEKIVEAAGLERGG